MNFKYYILSFVLLLVGRYNAQDIHFSQFNENPSLINPALTGESGVLRASACYRDQWRSVATPYKTYGASVESRFKTSNWDKVDGQSMTFTKSTFNRFAGGLSLYSDKAGSGNMGVTQLNASLASFVPISKNSQLSLGLQGSLAQYKIDFSKLVFSNQYDGYQYSSNIQNGESVTNQSFVYADFGGGLNWNYKYTDKVVSSNKQKKANIGIAIYHINKQDKSFLSNSNSLKLYMKYVFHGDFLFGIPHTNIGIAPSYLLQFQGPSKELIAGTVIKYYIKENSIYTGIIKRSSVNFGLFYRYKDAAILSFSYDRREQFSIGISYDVNLSKLVPASKLGGGPEITLKVNTSNPYLYQKRKKAD
ncbi:MAG: PorP/SprF family type IX secretion system membrane protein [Bacteroidetes bacterium]|nr:PorP/SprF family type IX secretion system membrane protein [Bacteroidota bacterium]